MVFETIRPLSRGDHFVSGELCLCTAGFVERLRLAVHKQSSPETKWPPRDKGLMVWNTITTAVRSCDSYSEGQFSVQAPVVILCLCLDMF